jgi:ureidoglycolate hydrolase
MKLVVRSLEQEIFKPFGRVLEPWSQEIPEVTEPGAFDFFVLFKESATSWQVGYLEQKADASVLVPAKYAVTTAERAMTDSTDKSISPLMMHSASAIARMPMKIA